MSTITLTFCDAVENHRGMQVVSVDEKQKGLSIEELKRVEEMFTELNINCEFIQLNKDDKCDSAGILVIRGGLQAMLNFSKYNMDDLIKEQYALSWDFDS